MDNLEERLYQIEERNRKVELDKAWEVSWTRRSLVALFTYLAIGLYLRAIQIDRPWINAIVPTLGFMISTLTLPFFKRWWMRNQTKKT